MPSSFRVMLRLALRLSFMGRKLAPADRHDDEPEIERGCDERQHDRRAPYALASLSVVHVAQSSHLSAVRHERSLPVRVAWSRSDTAQGPAAPTRGRGHLPTRAG